MMSLFNLRRHEKQIRGTVSEGDEESGGNADTELTDHSPGASVSEPSTSAAHVEYERTGPPDTCAMNLGKESWCLRASDSNVSFDGKRLSISLSSAVASLMVASLLATFVVTMMYVHQARYVYRFRHSLEVVDKHILRANYASFKKSSLLAMDILSDGNYTLGSNTGNVNNREDPIVRARRFLDDFSEQYREADRHSTELGRIHAEYEKYRDMSAASVCYRVLFVLDFETPLNVRMVS